MEKKKRITHVKSVDCGDMRPADIDYVSSFIKDLEANYERRKPKDFKIDQPAKVISKAEQKKSEKNKSIQSSSKYPSQLLKSKKFPLMEKSKKSLKQLKHNQSIPKQKAHLSYIPTSPAESNSTSNCSSNTLRIKDKTIANIKRNLPSNKTFHNERSENSSLQKYKSFLEGIEKSTPKTKEDSQNTVLKAHLNSKKIVPTSTKQPKASCKNVNKSNVSPVRSENSVGRAKKTKLLHGEDDCREGYYYRSHRNERSRANSSSRNNNSTSNRSNSIVNKESSNILNDKNGSTICDIDSDFEKFVQEIKKGIRKTSEISRKKAKTSQKMSRKRTVQKLSDSESSDDEGPPSNRKKNKRRKVSHKKVKSKARVVTADESEADPMDGDMFTRDSSPESDKSPVNATLSVQSRENENYVSLPEPSSGKDKAKSILLMSDEPEAGLMDGYVQKKDSFSHLQTDCGSLYVQSKDKDCYASLPEPSAITALDYLMASSFVKTISAKTCQNQLSCVNSPLGSDNSFENLNPISSESSMVINDVSNVENSKNEVQECIELSSSEDEWMETECLNSDVCLNSAMGKSSMTISVYSDAATATDPEKSDLKTVEAICHTPAKDYEESDIDILDIIVPESKNVKCSLETESNCSAFSPEENSVNSNIQIIKCEPQTRQILDIQIKKENEHPKNNVVTNNYHGAVFATDICKGFDSHEWPELHSDVNAEGKIKYASPEGSFCGQFTSSRIKKENNDYIINSAETFLELRDEKLSTENTNISSNQHIIAIKRELPDQMIDNFSEHKKSRGLLEVKTSNPIMQDKSQSNAAVNDLIPSLQVNKLNTPEKYIAVSLLYKFLIENSKPLKN